MYQYDYDQLVSIAEWDSYLRETTIDELEGLSETYDFADAFGLEG